MVKPTIMGDNATENHSNATSLNKDFYTFNIEKEKKPKLLTLRSMVLMQLFVVAIFILGLIIGLCIGLFANKDSSDKTHILASTLDCAVNKVITPEFKTTQKMSTFTTVTSQTVAVPTSTFSSSSPHINTSPNVNSKQDTDISLKYQAIGNTQSTPVPPEFECRTCTRRNPFVKNGRRQLFASLTGEEMQTAYDVLYKKGYINTKIGEKVYSTHNAIHAMYLRTPNKGKTLEFLDSGGKFPGRFAHVAVNRGSENPQYYTEYEVGPLDGPESDIKVEAMYEPGEIPYTRRPYDLFEIEGILLTIFNDLRDNLRPLLAESFDSPNPFSDLNAIPVGPYATPEGARVSRFSLSMRGLGNYDVDFLSALPISGYIDHESMNTSEWRIYNYYYLHQGPFDNSSHLIYAYNNDLIQKVRFPKGSKEYIKQTTFPQRDVYQPLRKKSEVPGPKTYDPSGPRFEINGNDITWLGWSFSATCNHLRGPSIFNVRFKNERILYENSLNDIALVYSADDPGKDNMVFTDAEYGIGNIKAVILGVDCPEHSVLLNITIWDPEFLRMVTRPGICIFEVDAQEALWRHKGKKFEVGIRNRYLVVRYPANIGNYDYTFDFEFHLDGKMNTKVMASGFILGSFFNPFTMNFGNSDGKTPFGYKVASFLTGPIHDHTFGFKVDVDIIDSKNNFELINWEFGDVTNAVNSMENANVTETPIYFFHNQTRYLRWKILKEEQGIKINPENQTFWTVVNNNAKNSWNVSRGYRIIPMATGSQNIQDDYTFINNIAFTKYHCSVTKRKEEEIYLKPAHKYYKSSSAKAKRYLQDMMDGENIVNEDLVTWLSVGFLHIPTSEDVPMTSRVQTGFSLKPFNFFDNTATNDLPQYTVSNRTLFEVEPMTHSCYIDPL